MARLQPDEDIDKFCGTFKTEVEDKYTKHFPPAMICLKDHPVPVYIKGVEKKPSPFDIWIFRGPI